MHLQHLALHVLAVINQRQILPLARRLAFDLDELNGMRYGLEDNDELRRQLQRKHHPFAGGDLDVLRL